MSDDPKALAPVGSSEVPNKPSADPQLDLTLAYHQDSKHYTHRFAPSLGYMDWATQPDPFRRFEGAPTFALEVDAPGSALRYESAFAAGTVDPAPLNATSIARLFRDSLALSAWKEIPESRWSLRVNPSSGNLHPTEGYLVSGPIRGLADRPGVYHYAPLAHALELRVELSVKVWGAIASQLPAGTLLVGLTSIYWRESWKYGQRAFRYCQHDVGHAIGCVAVSAAALGWDARLLEGVVDEDLSVLLGTHLQTGDEAEHPDCLIALSPQPNHLTSESGRGFRFEADLLADVRSSQWLGERNTLSRDHHDWPAIDEVASATAKHVPPDAEFWSPFSYVNDSLSPGDSPLLLRSIIQQRRSAVAFDPDSGITRDAFYQILLKAMPGNDQVPFTSLGWRPLVDLLLFVHRVQGIPSGLYVLVRDPDRKEALRSSMDPRFSWSRSDDCPDSLALFLLEEGDVRHVAQQTSCGQAIAADGVFAVAMLAQFRQPLEDFGPWFYRRLYWETGVVGQVLYLEAEASGIRGTGIGCFFDDLTHRVFGLEDDRSQVLYHFTMGAPLDDPRLRTHPPYEHLALSPEGREASTEG